MKLKRFKETNTRKIGVFIFTIVCVLLVSGVIFYRTFAVFEVKTNQNVINGTVQDPGDIYFAFYQKNEETGNYEIQKDMPDKNSGYVLDEETSYCGVTGANDSKIKVSLTEDWVVHVSGITTARTKCNLYFTKGIFIMGHGVPVVEEGDGLYEIKHENVANTLNDSGFSQTEYRYAGKDPKNYITFNGELWRIIGLVNVTMDDNNTIDQRVKVIRNEILGTYSWDSDTTDNNVVSDWSNATLNTILNDYYYNSKDNQQCYTGINKLESCSFGSKGLINVQNFIENVYWNIASYTVNDKKGFEFYETERGTSTPPDTDLTVWQGNIGLMYLSDYFYSTANDEMNFRYNCLNHTPSTWHTDMSECILSNWLYVDAFSWTISPSTDLGGKVANSLRYYTEFSVIGNNYVYGAEFVRPVFYFKPNVKVTSGTGSADDAFKIAQVIKN